MNNTNLVEKYHTVLQSVHQTINQNIDTSKLPSPFGFSLPFFSSSPITLSQRPTSSWPYTLPVGAILLYALACRILRYRARDRIHKKYNYPTRESFSKMTNDDAQAIGQFLGEMEFPYFYVTALSFGLFKVCYVVNTWSFPGLGCPCFLMIVYVLQWQSTINERKTDLRYTHHFQAPSGHQTTIHSKKCKQTLCRYACTLLKSHPSSSPPTHFKLGKEKERRNWHTIPITTHRHGSNDRRNSRQPPHLHSLHQNHLPSKLPPQQLPLYPQLGLPLHPSAIHRVPNPLHQHLWVARFDAPRDLRHQYIVEGYWWWDGD